MMAISSPGPSTSLIQRAAQIIVEAERQPHTAPAHWAGALWKAGMLVDPVMLDAAHSTRLERDAETLRDLAAGHPAADDMCEIAQRVADTAAELNMALRMHQVQFERANRIEAERNALQQRVHQLVETDRDLRQQIVSWIADYCALEVDRNALRARLDVVDRAGGRGVIRERADSVTGSAEAEWLASLAVRDEAFRIAQGEILGALEAKYGHDTAWEYVTRFARMLRAEAVLADRTGTALEQLAAAHGWTPAVGAVPEAEEKS